MQNDSANNNNARSNIHSRLPYFPCHLYRVRLAECRRKWDPYRARLVLLLHMHTNKLYKHILQSDVIIHIVQPDMTYEDDNAF